MTRIISTSRRLGAHWQWLPVLLGLVYLIVLLRDFGLIADGIYRNADAVSVPYIGELYGAAPRGADVVLGNFPWYFALWFEEFTRWLPHHRGLWEVAPYLFSLLGIAALAWSTWVVAGRWSATMTALLCLGASSGLLSLQFGWGVHGGVWPIVCFLNAYIVAIAGGFLTRRRRRMVGVSVVLALLTAASVASDNLLIVAGIVPVVLVGLASLRVLGRSRGRTVAAWTCGLAVTSVGVGLILRIAMKHAGVHSVEGYHVSLASMGQLRANLGVTFRALMNLYNGKFGGAAVGPRSLLSLSCALVVTMAAIAAFTYVRRTTVPFFKEAAPGDTLSAPDAARRVHLLYWAAVVVVLGSGFVLTTIPANDESARYIVAVGYGLATIVFVAARNSGVAWRVVAVAGAAAVLAANSIALYRDGILQNSARADAAVAPAIERIVKREHAETGYAGYWDAAPLGWQLRDVNVYPVIKCLDPKQHGLCAFYAHRIGSWYTPRPGVRSFLVLRGGFGPVDSVTEAPQALGRPVVRVQVSDRTVLIYDYDIASRIIH